MVVTLEEIKDYLRVDFEDDDALLVILLETAHRLCMDVMRTDKPEELAACACAKTAVLYAASYLYEHREEADHHELALTLRALLFGSRKEGF